MATIAARLGAVLESHQETQIQVETVAAVERRIMGMDHLEMVNPVETEAVPPLMMEVALLIAIPLLVAPVETHQQTTMGLDLRVETDPPPATTAVVTIHLVILMAVEANRQEIATTMTVTVPLKVGMALALGMVLQAMMLGTTRVMETVPALEMTPALEKMLALALVLALVLALALEMEMEMAMEVDKEEMAMAMDQVMEVTLNQPQLSPSQHHLLLANIAM